jgi:hypothetical protein
MLLVELVIQTWAFSGDRGAEAKPCIPDHHESKARSLLSDPGLWVCGAYYLVYQGIEGESHSDSHDRKLTINQLP